MTNPNDTARLEARLPAHVYTLIKRAAEMQGRTLTDFVVTAATPGTIARRSNAGRRHWIVISRPR